MTAHDSVKRQTNAIREEFQELLEKHVGKVKTHVFLYKHVPDGIYIGYMPSEHHIESENDALDKAVKAAQDNDIIRIIHVAKQ